MQKFRFDFTLYLLRRLELVPERMEKVTPRDTPLTMLALGGYGLVVLATTLRHEPWADEAQSWLLARDASLVHLWGTLLHYEGTPGLWQTLLHVLIGLGLPYSAYGFVSASLGFAAVYLLLRYAPLPIYIRLLLPFTYYLCYQYAVIARSYSLVAPLLFAIAAIYPDARSRPTLMTALLALLAAVSVHGFLISICIWVTLYASEPRALASGKLLIAGLTYWLILIVLLLCAWPAKDVAFAEHRGLSNLHLLPAVVKAGLAGAFTGYWITAIALIALSLPFLWRGGGWLFFLLATSAFFLFGAIVYAQLWHFGILFLAWIFAIWISAHKTRVTTTTILALVAAIGFQCYWTIDAIRYDWNHPYSGSLAAAQYLKLASPNGFPYAIGYPSVSIQPYFERNIYPDYQSGYWDWSKRNLADDPTALLASNRRDRVVVGYKNLAEKQHWANLLGMLGYSLALHFDGWTFWQTRPFEFEAYDLYRLTSETRAASNVNMADPVQAAQLLNGFYNIEGGRSRWTAKTFSVLLKVPPGDSAALSLKLYVPDVQIRNLGPITISAQVAGQELPSLVLSKPMEYTYSASVPAQALQSGFAVVNFRLDKSSTGLNGDARELGVVVTEVGLAPRSPRQ
jgi:hypothetical protein